MSTVKKNGKGEVKKFLSMLSDYDISNPVEQFFNEKSSEFGIGFLAPEVERDNQGVKLILRISAMIENVGVEDFKKQPHLKSIDIEYIDHDRIITFDVVEAVDVSGMEIEVVYRPRE